MLFLHIACRSDWNGYYGDEVRIQKAVISGHGHFRSFSFSTSVILIYSIIFILYYRGDLRPRNKNDRK